MLNFKWRNHVFVYASVRRRINQKFRAYCSFPTKPTISKSAMNLNKKIKQILVNLWFDTRHHNKRHDLDRMKRNLCSINYPFFSGFNHEHRTSNTHDPLWYINVFFTAFISEMKWNVNRSWLQIGPIWGWRMKDISLFANHKHTHSRHTHVRIEPTKSWRTRIHQLESEPK